MLEFRPRKKRSEDPLEATQLALDAARKRASFAAIAVVDAKGDIIASCGGSDVCQAMANEVRQIDPQKIHWQSQVKVGPETVVTTFASVPADGGQYYICAGGGNTDCVDDEVVNLALAMLRLRVR